MTFKERMAEMARRGGEYDLELNRVEYLILEGIVRESTVYFWSHDDFASSIESYLKGLELNYTRLDYNNFKVEL